MITIDLLANLMVACNQELVLCDLDLWIFPMISSVICLPFWDRIFCLLTVLFAWSVQLGNIRAMYKKLYGIADDCTNDALMFLGLISLITLPLIGYFDEHNYGHIHGPLAGVFFGCTGIYAYLLTGTMDKYKDKLPAEDQALVGTLKTIRMYMTISLLTLVVSILIMGSALLTPIAEWAVGLLFLNFFAFVVFSNDFYATIHPFGKLLPPGTVFAEQQEA